MWFWVKSSERLYGHIIFPTISPKTTQNVWKQKFVNHTKKILDNLSGQQEIDLVNEFAKPVSAEALKSITGLTNMTWPSHICKTSDRL